MAQQYDLICIGGGSGGIATANRAAQYGAKVAVIEANKLGGTCVNVGCVPKKIMWYAANHAQSLKDARDFGFDVPPTPFDWTDLVTKREAYIHRLNGLYEKGLNNNGVDYVHGFAKFVDTHTIEVNDKQYSAKKIVIATGGQPTVPDIEGAQYGITSDGFFELTEQPKRAVVIGAGYIAVELAGVLNALGTDTHLVVRKVKPLRAFDDDIIDALVAGMQKEGIELHAHANVAKVEKLSSGAKRVHLDTGQTLEDVDTLIWAIGRKANTHQLNLSHVGVDVLANGDVPSNELEQTNIPHIYSIGDINGKAALTPVAIAAGRRLADREFNDQTGRKLDYSLIATVIFSHPAIGTVGLSQTQAEAEYGAENITIFKSAFNPMSHAFNDHKPATMVKLVVHKTTDKVLGAHAIGPGVDEMIQGFAVAMGMGATKEDFDNTVAIHPTLSEELVTLK